MRSRVVHRLKEFKIEGKIGHGESPLSYQNIQYQVRDGEDMDYTWKEISSALIKAMKAGSSIRNHFEDNREMEKKDFMQMLESLIDDEEKDSAKLLTEMSSKVQGVKEKVQTYVLDMINLRKRILKVAIEEGNPLSEVLVRKWCTHAILVGLRLDPIRLEMRVIMKDPMIEEHEVMKKVKELVKMEKEHLQKMGEDEDDEEEENVSTKGKNGNKSNSNASKKTGEVNHINASDSWRNRNRDEKGKGVSFAGEAGKLEIDGSVLNAKLDLIANQMGECMEVIPAVRSLETDMRDLKKQMADMKNQSRRPFPFPSCEECKKTNTKCTHCAKCGQSGHKQADAVCPKNS